MVEAPGARVLSRLGEHSAVWLLIAGGGAALDRRERAAWLSAGRSVVVAHGVSVLLKRVFRVRRPAEEGRLVAVPSEWSFPSSHATGSAAAAVALGPLLPRALLLPLATGVAWSRVRLGVHRRRDVVAGAALGVLVGRWCVGNRSDADDGPSRVRASVEAGL